LRVERFQGGGDFPAGFRIEIANDLFNREPSVCFNGDSNQLVN
jgi:hypothetical protein